MTMRLAALCLSLAAAPYLGGCRAFFRPAVKVGKESEEAPRQERLNHGYALLYDLMSKESGAGKIFIFKDASEDTKAIVRVISAVAREAKQRLEFFDAADPALQMDQSNLPKTEVDTRGAIKWATTKELFLGDNFEVSFVLTQVKATQYAAHMALSLADDETVVERKTWLKALGNVFEDLNEKITSRLTVKAPAPPEE